jgi:hypothetical protein
LVYADGIAVGTGGWQILRRELCRRPSRRHSCRRPLVEVGPTDFCADSEP